MSTPCSAKASKTSCRNSWKRNREDGRILSRAAYIVPGITADGYKDILSITVGANETSKFWLGMLNDLKNRGVQDVLFFCVDGLAGFKVAISAVYPDAQIQRCVIHMLRNSFKYVNYGNLKKFSADFKGVYSAPNESAALQELGPGVKAVDRAVWGTADLLPVKGKAGTPHLIKTFRPYSIGINSIAGNPPSYSGGRVWAEPTDRFPAAHA